MFSEQGASGSHLAAVKFPGAIARMNGNDRQDSDAMSAYTQVEHTGVDTCVFTPKDRQPRNGAKYKNPVCKLKLNLYGHPLAGLFSETHCREALIACGFEAVKGWECLYKHAKDGIFISVYVDDFKMA